MNIQQFKNISHVDYDFIDMPEFEIELLARPGEKFKCYNGFGIFRRKIKANNYIYRIGIFKYGTVEDLLNYYKDKCLIKDEFSKELDRHVVRYKPRALVHFLDGTKQRICFENPDDVIKFMSSIGDLDYNNFLVVNDHKNCEFIGVGYISEEQISNLMDKNC